MIALKKFFTKPKIEFGLVQIFVENGKFVIHPEKGKPWRGWIPKEKQVWKGKPLPDAFKYVLGVLKGKGWHPEFVNGSSRFLWQGWGWETIIINRKGRRVCSGKEG